MITTQNAIEVGIKDGNVVFSCMNHLVTESSSQVNTQTIEKAISDKVRCELDNAVATI